MAIPGVVYVVVGFVLGLQFTWTRLLLLVLALYSLVFLAFCGAGRALVRSLADLPLVSLKLQLCVLSAIGAYIRRGFRPLYPNWTLAFEVMGKTMRYMFDNFGDVIAHENAAHMRGPFAMHGKLTIKGMCKRHHTRYESVRVNNQTQWWIRDQSASSSAQRLVVIHYHGGGFAMSDPLQDVELANITHTIVQQTLRNKYNVDVRVDVLLANYRKSPEHPHPTPFEDCLAVYEHVLATEGLPSNRVVLSGDSAGAWFSLAICKRLRESGHQDRQPLAALLYSPPADFEEVGGDEKTPHCVLGAAFVDAVHNGYLANMKGPARLEMSPVNWDLKELPPMFVQYGSIGRFYEQGMRLIKIAKEQGVSNWETDVLENMPHDAAMFPTNVLPYAEEAIRHASVFAAKCASTVLEKKL